jgi:hypothetical protein
MSRRPALLVIALSLAACQTIATPTPPPGFGPVSTLTATPSTQGVAWTQLDLPDAIGVWHASGVIADADGFVIYGGVNDVPAAWTSGDGLGWTSVALAGREGQPSAAAASADATVLIGGGSTSRCAHPVGEFLWRRVHGEAEWNQVPFREDLFCAGGSFSIAAREDLFMVAGMGTGDQPFAWRSADGLTWDDAAAGIPFDLPPWAIGVSDEQFFELGRGGQPDVRVTVDGTAWARIDPPPVAPAFNGDQPGMEPVVALGTGGGATAIYSADDGSATAAWRRDGPSSWLEVPMPVAAFIERVSGATMIFGVPYLFIQGAGRARLSVSRDLVTWADVDVPDVAVILGLARHRDRLVLVGARLDADGEPTQYVAFVSDPQPPRPAET